MTPEEYVKEFCSDLMEFADAKRDVLDEELFCEDCPYKVNAFTDAEWYGDERVPRATPQCPADFDPWTPLCPCHRYWRVIYNGAKGLDDIADYVREETEAEVAVC